MASDFLPCVSAGLMFVYCLCMSELHRKFTSTLWNNDQTQNIINRCVFFLPLQGGEPGGPGPPHTEGLSVFLWNIRTNLCYFIKTTVRKCEMITYCIGISQLLASKNTYGPFLIFCIVSCNTVVRKQHCKHNKQRISGRSTDNGPKEG